MGLTIDMCHIDISISGFNKNVGFLEVSFGIVPGHMFIWWIYRSLCQSLTVQFLFHSDQSLPKVKCSTRNKA